MPDHAVPAPLLEVRDVVAGYSGDPVVHGVSLQVQPGTLTAVVGPNGCGKSTLLRVMSRLLTPSAGAVELLGRSLADHRGREVAQSLAILPQTPVAPEGMTVADLVARGRQPHQPWYRQWSATDEQITDEAMSATGVDNLAERPLDELSGGQRQRAWIAMSLAQQARVLLLDEPTSHLDLAHAVEVLDLVVRLRRDGDRAVVVVLHDLALAARYCDRLVVMDAGRVVRDGRPADVLDAGLLREVFGLEARVFADPVDGRPIVVPVGHA